ncbi:MAG TPA: sensor domain-containing diguanylate cyclase [Thermoanaerobaculia bacterium]|nr:sensor domain-containing diguanylate cyclase [Thermoanaerobaculia bacterium]
MTTRDKSAASGVSQSDLEQLREELRRERSRRETLEHSYESLRAAFEKMEGGMVMIDADRVLYANPAVAELFGIPAERLRTMSRELFLREIAGLFDHPPDFLQLMRDRSLGAIEAREDVEMQRPRWRRIRWIGKALRLPSGKGQLAIFSDITEDADMATDRKRQALTDELTDLSNRRAGEQAISRETARSRRTGRPLSFALFDVDHFKRVNDTYGHQTGDLVLREVARFLSAFLRRSDIAVRWGGEEFLVILAGETLEGARAFAERVRGAIELLRVGDVGTITISAGTAELEQGEDPETTVARADANLYEAKARGRNQVV